MNVIIAGSTGMVGKLILESCVASEKIETVTTLVRKPSQTGNKIKEVVVKDFGDYSDQETLFEGMDIGFFCIGAYTGQVSDDL
ncbi:MAG: NAD(P)H-binding protein, partial [Bacteroidota bacterium]